MTDDDVADADAQAEYDADPELRELLTRAADSPTVHRDGVRERLRDHDGDDAGDGAAWVDRLRTGSRLRDVTDNDDGGEGGASVPS